MPIGCTNTKAANYDPAATEDDKSCIYLVKEAGVCYAFDETPVLKDESYTISYSFDGKNWVFFHDYVADFYFHTKKNLFSVKNNRIYKHNEGLPGVYYDSTPKSFFIDAVFSNDSEMILNSIQWIAEVLNQQKEVEFSTLTHITIWNNQQCTGRIAITDAVANMVYDRFKNKSIWNFDDFRDMVKTRGVNFLEDLFSNFNVISAQIDQNKPWFDQDLIHDNHFIIRFEFDNTSQKQVILHEAGISILNSPR
jgi:hypothetical protein